MLSNQKKIGIALIAFALFLYVSSHLWQRHVLGQALQNRADAKALLVTFSQEVANDESEVLRLKHLYPATYVASLTASGARALYQQAVQDLKAAQAADTTEDILAYSAKVSQGKDAAKKLRKERAAYVATLATAQAGYRSSLRVLATGLAGARSKVDGYYAQGYYRSAMAEAENAYAQAAACLARASAAASTHLAGGQVDFFESYKASKSGLAPLASALQAADIIPTLRSTNDSAIAELRSTANQLDDDRIRAVRAAEHLEGFSSYNCTSGVSSASSSVRRSFARLDSLERRNSMSVQDFRSVYSDLEDLHSSLISASQTFQSANDNWVNCNAALLVLASSRSDAHDAIKGAERRIRQYSEYEQDTAQRRVQSAWDEYNEGKRYATVDPIVSLRHFRSAESEGQSAYNAVVDQPTPTPRPTATPRPAPVRDSSGDDSDSWSSGRGSQSDRDDSPRQQQRAVSGNRDSGPSGSRASGASGSRVRGNGGF